jgi:hypothetical protein
VVAADDSRMLRNPQKMLESVIMFGSTNSVFFKSIRRFFLVGFLTMRPRLGSQRLRFRRGSAPGEGG